MGAHYKDSLFRSLFNNEATLLELYNAIKGTNFGSDDHVVINTLADTVFSVRKNDVSFTLNDRLVVLVDHQASLNENMPFRFLEPIARLLENSVTDKKAIYQRKRIPLPWPEFIVLYNGKDPYPERSVMRLAEAFKTPYGEDRANLELVVEVYNINEGHNQALLDKSEVLRGYAAFVGKAREQEAAIRKTDPGLKSEEVVVRAVAKAIEYCKGRGLLTEYWSRLTTEESNMLASEWNLEDAIAVAREESWEEGWEKGREVGQEVGWKKGWEEGRKEQTKLLSLFRQGYTADQIEAILAGGSHQSSSPPA